MGKACFEDAKTAAPYGLRVLGGFACSGPTGAAIKISARKNRALLAILALSPDMTIGRNQLAGLLWGDRGDEQARNSLRQALATTRREIGAGELLQAEDDMVSLKAEAFEVDALRLLEASTSDDEASLRVAAEAYQGVLLGDLSIQGTSFEEWLSIERSRFAEVGIQVMTRLSAHLSGREQIELLRRLVELDPLREASHRALMRAYSAAGENGKAIRQFELCRKILREDLGAEPAAETVQACADIRSGAGVVTQEESGPPDQRLSIALLPFANRSGNAALDIVCDAVTENIIDGLSRFHDLSVTASGSTFAHKGRNATIQQAAHELGVRFVLTGSVKAMGDDLRVMVELADGANGVLLWSDHFDRPKSGKFSVLDEVASVIVARLGAAYGGRIRKAWHRVSKRASPQDFRAYEYLQRGLDAYSDFSAGCTARARAYFDKAIEVDQDCAKAYAKIAWSHLTDIYLGWSADIQRSFAMALDCSNQAIQRDDSEAWGHWSLAGYYLHQQRHDLCLDECANALALNPNDADILNDEGIFLSYAGRADEGISVIERAMQLHPHYPEWWTMQLGGILFDARRYRDAVATLKRMQVVRNTSAEAYLAASYAALGEFQHAHETVRGLLALDPKATVAALTTKYRAPYLKSGDLDHLRRFLEEAGLPEA